MKCLIEFLRKLFSDDVPVPPTKNVSRTYRLAEIRAKNKKKAVSQSVD